MSGKKNSGEQSKTILEWISDHDSVLAEAIRAVNLDMALDPQNGNGVTFIFPEDQQFREELSAMADNLDTTEFSRHINSLILPEFFQRPGEFNSRTVGNSLGVAFKVNCEGGIMLKPASDFTNSNGRAVYVMVGKGRPPTTGGGYKKPTRPRRAQVRGGSNTQPPSAYRPRQETANRVEEEFHKCMAKDFCHSFNPYLASVVSLLNFLKLKHNELYKKALFVIDYEPISTFFILMEPYKVCGEHFIPDDVLFGNDGWNETFLCSNAVEEYMGFFREMADASSKIASQVDNARTRIMDIADPSQAIIALQTLYSISENQNSIEGFALPPAAKPTSKGLKLWRDELRFVIHLALLELRGQPYEAMAFRELFDDLRTTRAGNNHDNEVAVTKCNTGVHPKAELMFLAAFINSTAMLYNPCPPEYITRWGPSRPMAPNEAGVYNHNFFALTALKEVHGMVFPGGRPPAAAMGEKLRGQLYGAIEMPADT